MLSLFRKFSFLALLLLFFQPTFGVYNNPRVSILTCSPGEEVYSLFGHTALRVQWPERKMDVVFNYGLFSFDEPNFIWRFVLGETDYQLGAIDTDFFLAEYDLRGAQVIEQVINLDSMQCQEFFKSISENYKPQNRVYRYNYFYNNCTTKARDKLEEIIGVNGEIVYFPEDSLKNSFRTVIHSYTNDHLWFRFGMDILLGCDVDKPINLRLRQFAPSFLMETFSKSMINDTLGQLRPLVSDEIIVINKDSESDVENSYFPSPLLFSFILLFVACLVIFIEYRYKINFWGLDLFLFLLQGSTGLLLTFMALFSSHPAVNANWLLLWLNPYPFFALPWLLIAIIKRKYIYLLWIELIMLLAFIVFSWFLPQSFPIPLYVCAVLLAVRTLSNILLKK